MGSPAPDHSAAGGVPWARVAAAYRDGARVIQRLGSKFVDWTLPTGCPGWSAIDLAGHVLCVARTHHRLLDAALAGTPKHGLPTGAALDDDNAAELAVLGVTAGSDRIVAFDAVTTRYGERLADADPGLALGEWTGLGPMTLAEHTLGAAAEWHLHAWDLAGALGWDYRPADPAVLGSSWSEVLTASGRRPPAEARPFGP